MDFGFDVQEDMDFSQGVPTLKEIVLMHLRKISSICCAEFTKGYWEERPLKVGSGIAIMKKYNPDQRAVFCNSVDFLLWLVFPNSDENFKNKYKTFDDSNEGNWENKLKGRKKIFREITLMFERTNFFDTMSGRTETSKGKRK